MYEIHEWFSQNDTLVLVIWLKPYEILLAKAHHYHNYQNTF